MMLTAPGPVIESYDRAIVLAPNDRDAHLNRGIAPALATTKT
jgi:hypothetical protein